MPASLPRCPVCDVEITHDRHRFTSDQATAGASKISHQYCDDHCPRCDKEKISGK